MKKEVLLAIVIGFSLGLVITFGIYTARKALREKTPPLPTPSPQSQPQPAHTLTITSPENETLHNQETITLSGTTTPGSLVTILTPEAEILVYASEFGQFQSDISLTGGINEITIIALTPDGLKAEQALTLVYSTATIEP
ncbi:MAG: hypothetical protein HY381_01305 [Candidatus Chisholmbacteria bacterium]|nr:hypothetical protein [Candidatus Chisholmbacteria bacterium]